MPLLDEVRAHCGELGRVSPVCAELIKSGFGSLSAVTHWRRGNIPSVGLMLTQTQSPMSWRALCPGSMVEHLCGLATQPLTSLLLWREGLIYFVFLK